MVQGINSQTKNDVSFKTGVNDFFKRAVVKIAETRDVYEKSDENTKMGINSALAGASFVGTFIAMLGSRISKKALSGAKNAANSVNIKQNTPLKWLGAIISFVSSAAIVALNIKFDKPNDNVSGAEQVSQK